MNGERNKAPPSAGLDANYVTEKAAALVRQLHGWFVGATEFNGGWPMGERPDAILFSGQGSFLIETKITRSDFLADAKKEFRANSGLGVGRYRYYACPEGLIQPEELPDKWGLIYVFPNNKRAKMIVGYGGRIKVGEGRHPQHGWRVPVFEHHGCVAPEEINRLPDGYKHPEYPANRYAFHNKHTLSGVELPSLPREALQAAEVPRQRAVTPAEFKAARVRLGLSQSGMASALGLKDARSVRYYESGGREISGPIQVALAYMLKFGPFPEDYQPD